MKNISSFVLRDNLSTYLNDIEKSKSSFVINRYNKPVAKLVPYNNDAEILDTKRFFGFLDKDGKETGVEYVNKIRRSKREKDLVKAIRDETC